MKRIVRILGMILIVIMALTINSFAAVQVQIIPNNQRITNVTVSTSFQTCRAMDSVQSTLGTTSLDPHLATNKDWGAVSYFANSVYGVNTKYDTDVTSDQGKVGKQVKITWNGTENTFLSTTGNSSGVMNWGGAYNKNIYTQTVGLLDGGDTSKANIKLLVDNSTTRYVEKLTTNTVNNTKGMGITETNNWGVLSLFTTYKNEDRMFKYPLMMRVGLFGYVVADYYGGGHIGLNTFSGTEGQSSSYVTFRPVIWNLQ